MKRSPMPRSTKPLKRSRLKPVSDHRKGVNAERAQRQEEAWGPRPWQCRFNEFVLALHAIKGEMVDGGRCYGTVNGHEILWRGRAGSTDENLLDVTHQVPLCNHHNGWEDTHPLEAKRMGLALSAGESEEL